MFFSILSLILTVSLVLGAGALRLESNTTTTRPITRMNPKCEQSYGSPLLNDARKAANQLMDFSADRCSGTLGIPNSSKELCVTLHCFGTACISRCASAESTRSNQFTCTLLAESIIEVIEKPACWTKDQTKVVFYPIAVVSSLTPITAIHMDMCILPCIPEIQISSMCVRVAHMDVSAWNPSRDHWLPKYPYS
ncbi:hypothetical protein DFP73DRAFT_528670 [Morchella snyderi]|nr:hypothetical protein DFP73DRAFT_528670 [Morchella snyderi]